MNLRDARKLAGLTQVKLAAKASLPQQDISDFERGTRVPGFDQLVSLLTALQESGLRGVTAGDIEFGVTADATTDEQARTA